MASPVPVARPRSLHSFVLPGLKWARKPSNNNHSHGNNSVLSDLSLPCSTSTLLFEPPSNRSPGTHFASPSCSATATQPKNVLLPRENPTLSSPGMLVDQASSSDRTIGSSAETHKTGECGVDKPPIKFYVRLPRKKDDQNQCEAKPVENKEDSKSEADEFQFREPAPRTFNLRPRKGGKGKSYVQPNKAATPRCGVKKHQRKFSISISNEEITEDIFALTGAMPSKRPKKRPRALQNALDNLFPGMWLESITADSYKVSERKSKLH